MQERNKWGRAFAASVAIVATLLVGCASGPKVRSNFDKATDFSQYKTFGFASQLGTDREGYQTIVSQLLKAATRRELEARGFTYAESAPQLLVNFNAKFSDKLKTSTVPSAGPSYGYYGYRSGFYSPWPMYDETVVTSYTEGTLNIDLIDAAKKQMVWEGVAVGSVSEKAQENLQPAVDSVVAAIFKQFPVAAK